MTPSDPSSAPCRSRLKRLPALLLLLGASLACPAAGTPSYADWADLALTAQVVVNADISRVSPLHGKEAAGVPDGALLVLLQGRLRAALKAPAALPPGAEWLWQGKATKRNLPFRKGENVLLFARLAPAAGIPGAGKKDVQPYQLVSPEGQQPWSPEAEATVRRILEEALRAGGDPLVARVDGANTTSGPLLGEQLSQFFLTTQAGKPLTLVVRRQPGGPASETSAPEAPAPEVLATSSDLLSDARPVSPGSLLWYALACGLPEELPAALAQDAALVADYAAARTALGACGRTLSYPPQRVAR